MEPAVYSTQTEIKTAAKKNILSRMGREIGKNRLLYIMLVPGLIHLILFKWLPLFGLVIAFEDYSPFKGVFDSDWVGLKNFTKFFEDPYLLVLLKNTFLLAFYTLIFSFPIPILFALFLNEVNHRWVKKSVQSLSFLPYFISSAVTVSILYTFLSPQGGLINQLLNMLGIKSIFFMADPGWFRPLYVILNIWQTFGYGAIIYLAAITGIDPSLYEAAELDGDTRWQKMFFITLPSISNMIIVMFILNIGQILSVDLDKILIMYNPSTYSTADVIQTYVYRQAFASNGFPNYSYGAAVGLIQSIIALILITSANKVAKRYSDSRLF